MAYGYANIRMLFPCTRHTYEIRRADEKDPDSAATKAGGGRPGVRRRIRDVLADVGRGVCRLFRLMLSEGLSRWGHELLTKLQGEPGLELGWKDLGS